MEELRRLEADLDEFESLISDDGGARGPKEGEGEGEGEGAEEEEEEEIIEIDYEAFVEYLKGKEESGLPAWLKGEMAYNRKLKGNIAERKKAREEAAEWEDVAAVGKPRETKPAAPEEEDIADLKMRKEKKKVEQQLPEWAREWAVDKEAGEGGGGGTAADVLDVRVADGGDDDANDDADNDNNDDDDRCCYCRPDETGVAFLAGAVQRSRSGGTWHYYRSSYSSKMLKHKI